MINKPSEINKTRCCSSKMCFHLIYFVRKRFIQTNTCIFTTNRGVWWWWCGTRKPESRGRTLQTGCSKTSECRHVALDHCVHSDPTCTNPVWGGEPPNRWTVPFLSHKKKIKTKLKPNSGPPVSVFTGWWSHPDPSRSPAVTMWGGSSMKAAGCKTGDPCLQMNLTHLNSTGCIYTGDTWLCALFEPKKQTEKENVYSFNPAPLLAEYLVVHCTSYRLKKNPLPVNETSWGFSRSGSKIIPGESR